LPADWAGDAKELSEASANERVGTARSLSSGRASRGPVGAFAHSTLARRQVVDRHVFDHALTQWRRLLGHGVLLSDGLH
jgi:hypothetical protein